MNGREGLVPDFVPADLAAQGLMYHFSLAQLRPDGLAWKKDAAIEVIRSLADHSYAVLGGDVLELRGEQLTYSGDYWDLPDEDVVLWDEYVEHTKASSIAFIEDVTGRKGDSLFFAVFFIDERGYRKQLRDFGNLKYR